MAVRFVGRNLSTMLLAFALALAVWVMVVINSDPNQECEAPRSIALQIIGEDPGLEVMEDLPSQVRILFFAPRSVCDQLRDEESAVEAIVDLSGLSSGEHTVPVTPIVPERFEPYRILSYSPQEISLTLEPLVTQKFPIDLILTGEPALGFSADRPQSDIEEILISGPESLVLQVEKVVATLSIAGVRQSIQSSLTLQAVDGDGIPVSDVVLSPTRMEVSVRVQQLGGYREVAVKVNTKGQWASGFRLTNISVSPPTVTVFSANPQLVNGLPGFVDTVPVDLSDASDDLEVRVPLDLPEGITLVGQDQEVLVQVSIAAIESNLTMSLPVELIGLGPGLDVSISPRVVDVIFFGPIPVLETLTPEIVRVVVDLTELQEGSYQLTPFVDILPDPVQEQGINPGAVEVTISRLPTPTPTVTPEATGTQTPSP